MIRPAGRHVGERISPGPPGTRAPGRRGRHVLALLAAGGVLVAGVVITRDVELPSTMDQVTTRPDGTVTVALDSPVNTVRPRQQFGAGIDGLEHGEIDTVWTPRNITAMRSAGFGPISYRLRTELGVKAWHWNATGTWSDAAHRQGYWTSADTITKDADVSYGYHLPRRGNTIDQANNDGYSRLDDGDDATFWKSNPYLDARYTRQGADAHPQWIMIAFDEAHSVQDLRIAWGTPHANRFRVQYWVGSNDAIWPSAEKAHWQDVPSATHTGTGGCRRSGCPRIRSAPSSSGSC